MVTSAVALPALGCGYFPAPRWFNPGPASYQRAEAEVFDPYPDPIMGPKIDGGRPIDYAHPTPEPERGRINPFSFGS
ncbi:MAG: membrane or secreted protein [Pirellulales bacterium]